MELTFLGATQTVTGSSFLLSVGDRRVMVDCGLYQGLPQLQERNYTHPSVDWSEVDAILLTHAHIDHSGLIPRAVRLGFSGPIYAHGATFDLAEIMLKDSAEIHEKDANWLSRKRKRAGKYKVEPLFTMVDVEQALMKFKNVEYGKPVEIGPGMVAEFRDAGHILGAASIAIDCTEGDLKKRVVFSGDIGNHQAPILREPQTFDRADVVLIETTYGNRLHESKEDRVEILKKIIDDAFKKRSKVVIPAFTVGRTQELLYIIGEMMEDRVVPKIPIFLDSPMAISATQVHEKHPECYDRETLDRLKAGENPFNPSTLVLCRSVDDSRKINYHRGAAIIIAGGGMCEGGRIVHHLKHNLYDPDSYLVFVGYQAQGTLGRVIQNGRKSLRLFGEQIAVKAKVTSIGAFSAHADRDGLTHWLAQLDSPPDVVFTVHGEKSASEDFGNHVRKELGYQAYLPRLGQVVDLARLDVVDTADRIFTRTPAPSVSDVRQMVARVSMMGQEFQKTLQDYTRELAGRINEEEESGLDAHWKTIDTREIMGHLSEAVGGDIDRLENLLDSTESID